MSGMTFTVAKSGHMATSYPLEEMTNTNANRGVSQDCDSYDLSAKDPETYSLTASRI